MSNSIDIRNVEYMIKKNYLYNVSYQILLLIIPLITTPYISRVLGADGIGRVSFAESMTSYFVLFASLSITTYYGQREISYVRNSKYELSRVFWETKITNIIISVFVLTAYIVFSSYQQDQRLLYILGIMILDVFVDITWFFQGIEEFGKIVIRNTLIKLIGVAFIFLFIKNENDIYKYAFGIVFFTLFGNISMWLYLPRYLCKVSIKDIRLFNNFKTILSLFIPSVAIKVYTVLDKTMIGLITKSSFENGYYEQALKISRMTLTIITALGTVMIPRIGYYYSNNETKKIESYMYKAYRFVWLLGIPLCFGLIGISDNFVPWFFGKGYTEVASLLKILAFLILAIGINNVTGVQYFIPTGRQNMFTLTVSIGAVVNFVLNSVLIRLFLSEGAAIASVVAETVIAITQIIIARKEIKPFMVIRFLPKYAIAGTIMLILLRIENHYFQAGIIYTCIMIFTGCIVYGITLIIEKDDFIFSYFNKIKK